MPADPKSQRSLEPDWLEAATDQIIAACGGNPRHAVTAPIVANEFLEAQVRELQSAVSNGYARVAGLSYHRATARIGMI